jgi:hypothetical protein
MTTIAWDGERLAADCQTVINDTRSPVDKIWQLPNGHVCAVSGDLDYGMEMVDWYANGAIREKLPAVQGSDCWVRLTVARGRGDCIFYERYGIAIKVMAKHCAWGSGAKFALGALTMGADAHRAVEVAILHDINSGFGVKCFTPLLIPGQVGGPVCAPKPLTSFGVPALCVV